jgi:hypothetical protein
MSNDYTDGEGHYKTHTDDNHYPIHYVTGAPTFNRYHATCVPGDVQIDTWDIDGNHDSDFCSNCGGCLCDKCTEKGQIKI